MADYFPHLPIFVRPGKVIGQTALVSVVHLSFWPSLLFIIVLVGVSAGGRIIEAGEGAMSTGTGRRPGTGTGGRTMGRRGSTTMTTIARGRLQEEGMYESTVHQVRQVILRCPP